MDAEQVLGMLSEVETEAESTYNDSESDGMDSDECGNYSESGESIYTEDENSTNGDSSDDMDENRGEPSARRATRGRGLRSRGAGRGRAAVTGARRGRGSGRMRGIAGSRVLAEDLYKWKIVDEGRYDIQSTKN